MIDGIPKGRTSLLRTTRPGRSLHADTKIIPSSAYEEMMERVLSEIQRRKSMTLQEIQEFVGYWANKKTLGEYLQEAVQDGTLVKTVVRDHVNMTRRNVYEVGEGKQGIDD